MALPQGLTLSQMQNVWASQLNPTLSNPINRCSILKDVILISGLNVINHKLGAKQSGWFLTDLNGSANIYRSAPFNDLTLSLTSDANVTVSIGVF